VSSNPPTAVEAVLEKKKRYLIPCTYHFYKTPPLMVRGEGVHLFDSTGRRYLDLYSGVSVNALGHCHPELTEAICRQVKTLQHTTTIYLTEPIISLAEALAQVLPGEIRRTFFCASGSEANEGAALLATLHTGRNEFLAFQNGLHGRTKLTMSLTGLSFWRTDPSPVGGITHVPAPHCKRCPLSRTYGSCGFECVGAMETAIRTSTSGRPAAMFVEPIQGNGGIVTPPPEYFPRLRSLLADYGALLIADEVQTGFGRTGRMFAMNHWDVQPDILTGAKALGGGTPIGFFSTTDQIASSYTRPGASTFGGNPVTATAALSFLHILQRDGLVERSAQLGKMLKDRLRDLARRDDVIEDVRGLGLMVGAELRSRNAVSPAEVTDRVLEEMKDAGFLLGKTGPQRNVLTFMPPLIIKKSELGGAVDALEKVLGKL
jgi:4-aminobutyrate aminotransferase/4-aminobutyrate aminotransferase/(S)-3-amino-2-methylpropionate transaminase